MGLLSDFSQYNSKDRDADINILYSRGEVDTPRRIKIA